MGLTFRRLAPLMDLVPYRNAERVAALVGRGRWLVDVGGGTGRVARRVRGGFERVLVADVERSMLTRARERGLDVVLADAASLPVRSDAVDAVLSVDAFHHFPDQRSALAEAGRVLAAGGRVVLEEFDPSAWRGRAVEFFESLARFGSTFRRPEELARLVREATGLDADVQRFSRWEYAVTAAKRR